MGIDNLPRRSGSFRATSGAGSFKRKFTSATKFGSLKNLRDNKEGVLKAIKKYERSIKLGSFNRKSRISAMKMIKASEKKKGRMLTRDDRKDIRKVFNHLATKSSATPTKVRAKAEPLDRPRTRLGASPIRSRVMPNGRLNTGLANQNPETPPRASVDQPSSFPGGGLALK